MCTMCFVECDLCSLYSNAQFRRLPSVDSHGKGKFVTKCRKNSSFDVNHIVAFFVEHRSS